MEERGGEEENFKEVQTKERESKREVEEKKERRDERIKKKRRGVARGHGKRRRDGK